MKKIVINGFGRIGRIAFRMLFGSDEYEVVAINSHGSSEDIAYLLKYDTVHRTMFEDEIEVSEEGIYVDGHFTRVLRIDDPKDYPWRALDVDLVLDCTGAFTKDSDAVKHIEAGAKKVLISAPGKGNMKTIVYGVNDNTLTVDDKIVSSASCTTNCLAPVLNLIDRFIGIESGFMTTIHAYTNDQNTLDGSHKKGISSRRGRAAAENIVPASTGAASAIGLVLPNLNGKLEGSAFRVPVSDGSCIDLSLTLKRETTKEEINNIFKAYQNDILKFTTEPIVSSDIIGNPCGSLVDGSLTSVLESNKKQVKIVAWYDNEYGYTAQMIRTMDKMLNLK
jgi:glyceraldehyde 3-phosphate dehydrogenase